MEGEGYHVLCIDYERFCNISENFISKPRLRQKLTRMFRVEIMLVTNAIKDRNSQRFFRILHFMGENK